MVALLLVIREEFADEVELSSVVLFEACFVFIREAAVAGEFLFNDNDDVVDLAGVAIILSPALLSL